MDPLFLCEDIDLLKYVAFRQPGELFAIPLIGLYPGARFDGDEGRRSDDCFYTVFCEFIVEPEAERPCLVSYLNDTAIESIKCLL